MAAPGMPPHHGLPTMPGDGSDVCDSDNNKRSLRCSMTAAVMARLVFRSTSPNAHLSAGWARMHLI
eukprot:222070-Chlamydomonas_euryale.AAC.1